MTFTQDNGLVKIWVRLVQAGSYTLDQVPQLYNLKLIVSEVVNGTTA